MGLGVVAGVGYYFSPSYTDVGYQPAQPIVFSHRLHAGDLGMDCRYCHNTVERAAVAAVPPTATCMNCHETIGKTNVNVDPLRKAFVADQSLAWTRVHMLPDYAYFDHSVHLAAGVGCATCHGRIDQMDVVTQQQPLSMSWCLECHRNPQAALRPREEITNMAWSAAAADYNPHHDPARARWPTAPEACSGCHR